MDKFNNFFTNSILKLNTRNILIILFLISLFKNGIWYHPALWNMLEIAKNPFENVFGSSTEKYYLYRIWKMACVFKRISQRLMVGEK